MKKLIAVALVLFSTATAAEPSGSLKTMMETPISLIEYLELKVLLDSLKSIAKQDVSTWKVKDDQYKSVVTTSMFFDYSENKLIYELSPVTIHELNSIKHAKAYCRALIERHRHIAWFHSRFNTTPHGYGTGITLSEDFTKDALKNTVIRTTIKDIAFMFANLPKNLPPLECKASLNEAGEIAKWSFNL